MSLKKTASHLTWHGKDGSHIELEVIPGKKNIQGMHLGVMININRFSLDVSGEKLNFRGGRVWFPEESWAGSIEAIADTLGGYIYLESYSRYPHTLRAIKEALIHPLTEMGILQAVGTALGSANEHNVRVEGERDEEAHRAPPGEDSILALDFELSSYEAWKLDPPGLEVKLKRIRGILFDEEFEEGGYPLLNFRVGKELGVEVGTQYGRGEPIKTYIGDPFWAYKISRTVAAEITKSLHVPPTSLRTAEFLIIQRLTASGFANKLQAEIQKVKDGTELKGEILKTASGEKNMKSEKSITVSYLLSKVAGDLSPELAGLRAKANGLGALHGELKSFNFSSVDPSEGVQWLNGHITTHLSEMGVGQDTLRAAWELQNALMGSMTGADKSIHDAQNKLADAIHAEKMAAADEYLKKYTPENKQHLPDSMRIEIQPIISSVGGRRTVTIQVTVTGSFQGQKLDSTIHIPGAAPGEVIQNMNNHVMKTIWEHYKPKFPGLWRDFTVLSSKALRDAYHHDPVEKY